MSNRTLDNAEVIEFACELGEVELSAIHDGSRNSNVMDVRHALAMFWINNKSQLQIAALLHKDHSTISSMLNNRQLTPNAKRILDGLKKAYANDLSYWARKLAIDPQNDYIQKQVKQYL